MCDHFPDVRKMVVGLKCYDHIVDANKMVSLVCSSLLFVCIGVRSWFLSKPEFGFRS